MNWVRWVRRELFAYNALQADRRELQKRIEDIDKDISPKASRLDGMPRPRGGLPKSSVEVTAIQREKSIEDLERQLEMINRRLAPIERALSRLDEQEREVIQLSFHSLDGQDDELAQQLGMSPREFENIKYYAMLRIARQLELYGRLTATKGGEQDGVSKQNAH